jgi:hypothetical protein
MSFALFGSCLIAERNDESGSGKQDKEWLFNKSENTGGVFAGACFPEPAGVVYNVVRAFIYYDNGKIPSSILIVALNPYLQYNWIINSSIVMFLPMNPKTNRRC